MFAKPFWRPIVHVRRRRLRCFVKNENQRSSCLGAGRREVHRRASWHDDISATCATNLCTFRCLQACLAGQGVPSFRTRMSMGRSGHSRSGDGLHVLSRVRLGSGYGKRADFGDMFTTCRSPALFLDAEQPDFSERLSDRAARLLGPLGIRTGRVNIEMPDRPVHSSAP